MGDIKVPVFKFLQGYCLKIFMSRDNGRSMGDAGTFREKKFLSEVGRRAEDRGLLDGDQDFYFLSIYELWELLEGKEPPALSRAKVAARRKSFVYRDKVIPGTLAGTQQIRESKGPAENRGAGDILLDQSRCVSGGAVHLLSPS